MLLHVKDETLQLIPMCGRKANVGVGQHPPTVHTLEYIDMKIAHTIKYCETYSHPQILRHPRPSASKSNIIYSSFGFHQPYGELFASSNRPLCEFSTGVRSWFVHVSQGSRGHHFDGHQLASTGSGMKIVLYCEA